MRFRAPPSIALGLTILASINGWLLVDIFSQLSAKNVLSVEKVTWTPKLADLGRFQVPAKAPSRHQSSLARPLFFKSRRPFVSRPTPSRLIPAPAPKAFVDPRFVLRGVMINGSTKKAYISRSVDRSGAWVTEGNNFGGWEVKSISNGAARIQKHTHIIELKLYPNH